MRIVNSLTHKLLQFSIVGIPQGVAVPPSLQEALDNLEHDVAEVRYCAVTSLRDESELETFHSVLLIIQAQKDAIAETEGIN